MTTGAVEKEFSAKSIALVLVAATAFVGLILGALEYGAQYRQSWKSDLVEISTAPGEYVLAIPSKEIGMNAMEARAKYGQMHPDRQVRSAELVVVIDQAGQAKIYYKIFYLPR